MCSLHLLGSVRSYKDLIRKLNQEQEFRFPDTDLRLTCRLLTVSGKRKYKTVRFHKSALPLLQNFDGRAYQYYLDAFRDHSFSGNQNHVDRNHRIAETALMCMKAGIEARPTESAYLMSTEVRHLQVQKPYFYLARELKQVNAYELNKIRFTRLAGAIVYPGGAYAVYNNRDQMLNWMGEGERKIRNHLQSIFTPMYNFSFPLREAAVMFGNSYDVALEMMEELRQTQQMDNGLFATYTSIFFIPMDAFGVRLLRIITVPNWPERIMKGLFKPEVRSYGRGSFTYDAYDNGVYFLSFLDGDLWRLFRFREAILDRKCIFRVVCFQEQIPFLKKYMGDKVTLSTVKMETAERVFGIEERCFL
jgi:hypothetical protein